MIERSVRNMHSSKPMPTLFCKVKADRGKAVLVTKDTNKRFREIPWEDLRYQVETAIEESKQS